MGLPSITRGQGAAFIAAANGHKRTLHEILCLTGLDFLIAAECMAHEAAAGRLAVRDDVRTHVWIDILCIPSWAWPECKREGRA